MTLSKLSFVDLSSVETFNRSVLLTQFRLQTCPYFQVNRRGIRIRGRRERQHQQASII